MKKKVVFILFGVLFSTVIFAQSNPAWLKKAIIYQIYPSSYQDSNGDGYGDLKGIQSRLDYIKSLGVNTIWVGPLSMSGFTDGGYDVIDYYKIDPRFGTNAGFMEFIKEAHAKGLHVMIDLVPGHTSDQSQWFIQSQEADTNLQYSDFFVWAPNKPSDLTQAEARRWVEANKPRAKYYIHNHYPSQPALNYGFEHPNPNHPWEQSPGAPGPQAVIQEMKDVIAFWMNKGADGFRIDLASGIVKNDPDKTGSMRVWSNITKWYGEKFPEGALLGQWSNPKQSVQVAGLNLDFFRAGTLLSSRDSVPKPIYFSADGKGSFADWYTAMKDQYATANGKGYIVFTTGGHGGQRMASGTLVNDFEQLKVAMTLYLMAPSLPLLYYGDEIGMRLLVNSPPVDGSLARSSSRTPMQWNSSVNAGFSTAAEAKIYLPIDSDPKRPTVEAQQNDPNSLLNYVRKLTALRVSTEALCNASNWELLTDVNKPYPMVLYRWINNEKYIIAINPSGKKVETTIPSRGETKAEYIMGNTTKSTYKITKDKNSIVQLPPVSAAIFKLE